MLWWIEYTVSVMEIIDLLQLNASINTHIIEFHNEIHFKMYTGFWGWSVTSHKRMQNKSNHSLVITIDMHIKQWTSCTNVSISSIRTGIAPRISSQFYTTPGKQSSGCFPILSFELSFNPYFVCTLYQFFWTAQHK